MRTTWQRRLVILVVAGILGGLVVRAGLDAWAARRVNAAAARLEQQFGPLDEDVLVVPPVPPGDNRARAFRAAAALVDFASLSDSAGLGLSMARMREVQSDAPLPADLRAFVVANEPALQIAQEARTRSRSNWEADYTMATNTPPWLDVRTLSNTLYLAARRDLDDGRVEDAAMTASLGLALSASVRQEPSVVAQLMRCAFGLQHFEAVQRILMQAEPSAAALGELARWLAEDRTNPMDVGLRGELAYFHSALTALERGDRRAGALAGLPSWFVTPAWLGRPLARLAHAQYLEAVGQILEIQFGPRPRPAWTPPSGRVFLTGFGTLASAGLARTMETGDLFTTERGLAEVAVGLRRYQLEHGRYPDALSALVPAYVSELPIDATTGKPPTYAREGAGFRLHAEAPATVTGQRAAMLNWVIPQ